MLRFHWRLPQGGERPGASRAFQASLTETGLPDLDAQIQFCRAAEENGIESLLIDFGWSKPDPILLAAALGLATERIKFIIAHRSGLTCPTSFVQQVNTLSTLINGRFSLNIVAGHSPPEQRGYGDLLSHDERYERTEEFLAICHAYWRDPREVNFSGKYYTIENGKLNTPFRSADRTFPELYIAGNSSAAQRLSITQGSCWMQLPVAPERLAARARQVLQHGKEVGLRCAIIARRTHAEAVSAARTLAAQAGKQFDDRGIETEFIKHSDSVCFNELFELAQTEWLTSYLWTGVVRSHGAPAVALVGSASEIASAIIEYKNVGVSQFIISGWPKLEEMLFFAKEVLPLVREMENQTSARRVESRSIGSDLQGTTFRMLAGKLKT
ncbi:MAG TPA: LLM class flavin-dependent oxidoreductase [Blastocatellia bacterium]|nr:LLM class flavin-dependent oxidoreductase [Blastocatellia bacterium]